MATRFHAEGRRLVREDGSFEVGADYREFPVTYYDEADEVTYQAYSSDGRQLISGYAVVRVWVNRVGMWTVMAVSETGAVEAQARASTYKEALSEVRSQIES